MALRGTLAGLALLAASCAPFERPASPAPPAPPPVPALPNVDPIIAEAVQAARAPQPEQKAALARAERAFLAEMSALNRLRLATLLATVPEPLRDDMRALELLEPIADASVAGTGRLAALLTTYIAERRRLGRELERSAREHERNDRERDRREAELRQQLEALRAIERGILQREEKLRRRQN